MFLRLLPVGALLASVGVGCTPRTACSASSGGTCAATPEVPPRLVSDAGAAIHAEVAPVQGDVSAAWVETFDDWSRLEARLAAFGATLGEHEDVDFARDQVLLAWERSGTRCDDGTHFQGIDGAVAVYTTVYPCDTRCDVSSEWFGDLFVVPRGDLAVCETTWTCSPPDGDTAWGECPDAPPYTMLNAP